MSGESMINSLSISPLKAVGIIDFAGAGGAGGWVKIGGVTFQEADVAAAANGVWTNGATAPDSMNSLIAAINGGYGKLGITAVASVEGNSVIVVANDSGVQFNHEILVSGANIAAQSMTGGDDGRAEAMLVARAVTAADVLADEINIGLPFVPAQAPIAFFMTNVGLWIATQPTGTGSIQTNPLRYRYLFAGAVDPTAGMIMYAICYRR